MHEVRAPSRRCAIYSHEVCGNGASELTVGELMQMALWSRRHQGRAEGCRQPSSAGLAPQFWTLTIHVVLPDLSDLLSIRSPELNWQHPFLALGCWQRGGHPAGTTGLS
jgi:hypothetical protein